MLNIAVDAMGGDLEESASVGGIDLYLSRFQGDDVFFHIFGNADKITQKISKCRYVSSERCQVFDTGDRKVSSDEKPSAAVRKGRGTSMFEAISRVASGQADAVVSSGNTGAYMALSKVLLGTLDDVERPALVSVMPNIKGHSIMLDLGANTECSSTKLIQFALMGQAVARVLLKIDDPSVGLLNIGTERSKGTDALESAFNFLDSARSVNFIGFIEGTDITKGTSDVIVTDGFSGNISLKTMEGTIGYLAHLFKSEIKSSVLGKIGLLFCSRIVKNMKNRIDPRNYNGAPLVGLKKIAVKSHGGSDSIGFANAISAAVRLVKSDFINNMQEAMSIMEVEKSNENCNKKC